MNCSNQIKNTGNVSCGNDIAFEFPAYTIFCHPDNEDYFKSRCGNGVNVLTSRYLMKNQFVKSKDLHITYTEPEIGLDKDDFENNRFTVKCWIKSIERI